MSIFLFLLETLFRGDRVMVRLGLLFLAIAVLACMGSVTVSAAPKLKTLPIRQVPEIIYYVEHVYKDYDLDHPDQFHIRVGDLDQPSNGVNEYIISVNPLTPDTCGPRGCPQEVVRLGIMNSVVSVYTSLGPKLEIDDRVAKKIAGLLAKSNAEHPHPRPLPRTVDLRKVPGLADYLSQKYGESWQAKEEVFDVRTFNLDESHEDRHDEVLLSIDKFDPELCDNSGCVHEVLVRQPDGTLEAVTSYRGFGLKVADTSANGVRDLISETSRGNRRFNLSGETSGTRSRKKTNPNIKEISATTSANGLEEFRPECFEGSSWFGHSGNGSGGASYNGCDSGHDWLLISCKMGSNNIRLTIETAMKRARDGMAVTVPFVVDGKRFNLRGRAQFSEMMGGAHPILTFDRKNGLMEALMSGSHGSFFINKEKYPFHLQGAKGSIGTMLKGCGAHADKPPLKSASSKASTPTRNPVIVVTKALITGRGFADAEEKRFHLAVCKGTPHVTVVNKSGQSQEIWMGPPDSGNIYWEKLLRNGQNARIGLIGVTGIQLPEYTVLNARKDFSYALKLVDCQR